MLSRADAHGPSGICKPRTTYNNMHMHMKVFGQRRELQRLRGSASEVGARTDRRTQLLRYRQSPVTDQSYLRSGSYFRLPVKLHQL